MSKKKSAGPRNWNRKSPRETWWHHVKVQWTPSRRFCSYEKVNRGSEVKWPEVFGGKWEWRVGLEKIRGVYSVSAFQIQSTGAELVLPSRNLLQSTQCAYHLLWSFCIPQVQTLCKTAGSFGHGLQRNGGFKVSRIWETSLPLGMTSMLNLQWSFL